MAAAFIKEPPPCLRFISLRRTGLSDAVPSLGTLLRTVPYLDVLDLSDNPQFGDDGIRSIVEHGCVAARLRILALRNCGVTRTSADGILEILTKNNVRSTAPYLTILSMHFSLFFLILLIGRLSTVNGASYRNVRPSPHLT